MKPTNNTPTFKEAFCAIYRCRPEDYTKEMLLRSFKWHAAWIGRILLALDSPSIRPAVEAVNLLGQAEDTHEVVLILNDYRYQLRKPPISAWVRSFNIRLSGNRMLNMYKKVTQQTTQAGSFSRSVESNGMKNTFQQPVIAQI